MPKTEKAVFAGGCFWCTEAIFNRLRGVLSVVPGYTGGHVANPSYEEVCSGDTGHAEAIQITYDPNQISFENLLDVFWHTHNPTTLNRQGNDIGSQYRSAIFFTSKEQEQSAKKSKSLLEAQHEFDQPIVTTIEPLTLFYLAENYHHDYFKKHQDAPYCSLIIAPKIKHLLDAFGNLTKTD